MANTPSSSPREALPEKPAHVRLATYYAFDLDGNVLRLPTKIVAKRHGKKVDLDPSEFAALQADIRAGKDGWERLPDDEMFHWFSEEHDDDFVDQMEKVAEPGPAFDDLKEAFNSGSVMFVITARRHSVAAMKKGFKAFFLSARAQEMGIDHGKFMEAMRYYQRVTGAKRRPKAETIEAYLDHYLGLCDFYPVKNRAVGADLAKGAEKGLDVEGLKNVATERVLASVNRLASVLPGKPKPRLGFSDDTPINVESVVERFRGETSGVLFSVYSTAGGKRRKVAQLDQMERN